MMHMSAGALGDYVEFTRLYAVLNLHFILITIIIIDSFFAWLAQICYLVHLESKEFYINNCFCPVRKSGYYVIS